MNSRCDVVLINPGDRKQVYQKLGKDLAAIEPPFWIAAIAAFLRKRNFSVKIIDSNVENISPDKTATKVNELNPLLSVIIVYGSNPSASTPNMTMAGRICTALKKNTSSKVGIGGLHPSALPKRTIQEEDVDFVIEGEGPYTLIPLIETLKRRSKDYSDIPELWYFNNDSVKNNRRAQLIENLDEGMQISAWDLLPMQKYRAHNWHCFDDIDNRMPYAAIYTSLGCPYACTFCCINAPFGKSGIRYRSPQVVIEEIGVLVEKHAVKNLKIIDELFVLNEKHYMSIVDLILARGYDLNMWAYARVDSIKLQNLEKMKQAGINWLGIGIESASEFVRNGVNKQMRKKDIKNIVRNIQGAGIRVGANYIFGLPDDTMDTMQETLEFALELNTELSNFYCAMAYPGSKLYDIAVREGMELPKEWYGYSQFSYETLPLPTKYLSSSEVLRFRDKAFKMYYASPKYVQMMHNTFGPKIVEHIKDVTSKKLERKHTQF